MKNNKITIQEHVFNEGAILNGNVFLSDSLPGDELSIDTLRATLVSTDSLVGTPYGADVLYHHDETLIGKFYISSVKRAGKDRYEVHAISAIGLLDNTTHYGGIYTGQTMETVLTDLIGGVFPYVLNPVFRK